MWSTTDEIRFINGLGQHRNPSAVVPYHEKLEHLKRYLEGIRLRVRWGNIDPVEVEQYVLKQIDRYESYRNNPPTQ